MKTTKPTFNLLSIGHRGVGKTVFLAGSYIELHGQNRHALQQKLWFDCQQKQVQEKIDSLLGYVSDKGDYPPPTMKIKDFCFSLKQGQFLGSQTLCYFRWLDIPGEICNFQNPDFRAMVSNSDGCCVFIDAYALLNSTNTYLKYLEEIIKQVTAIASLAFLHDCKYPFVIILTKCDLLETLLTQQIQAFLKPLFACLDTVKANYQTFYSSIPLDRTPDSATLKPTGAANPMLWLVWQLSQTKNLKQSNIFQIFPVLVDRVSPRQRVKVGSTVQVQQKKLAENLLSITHTPSHLLVIAIAFVASVGIISLVYQYIKVTPNRSPEQITAPSTKSKLYRNTEGQAYNK